MVKWIKQKPRGRLRPLEQQKEKSWSSQHRFQANSRCKGLTTDEVEEMVAVMEASLKKEIDSLRVQSEKGLHTLIHTEKDS